DRRPSIHFALLKLSSDRRVLFISLPAIYSDVVGLRNLARELALSYQANSESQIRRDAPLQYADYFAWQTEFLESDETEAGREYWRRRSLHRAPPVNLPLEKAAAGQKKFTLAFFNSRITEGVTVRIEELAQRQEGSVAGFLLTCWQALLRRITRQSDIT